MHKYAIYDMIHDICLCLFPLSIVVAMPQKLETNAIQNHQHLSWAFWELKTPNLSKHHSSCQKNRTNHQKNHHQKIDVAKSRSMDPLANSAPLGPRAVTTSLSSSANHRGGGGGRFWRRPKARSSSGDSTEGSSWARGQPTAGHQAGGLGYGEALEWGWKHWENPWKILMLVDYGKLLCHKHLKTI